MTAPPPIRSQDVYRSVLVLAEYNDVFIEFIFYSYLNFAAIGSSSFGSSSIGSSKSTNQQMRNGITVIWQKRFRIIRTGISKRTGIRVALMYLFLWFHNGTGISVDLSYLFLWFHHGTDIRLVSRCLSFCPKSVC